MKVFRIIRKDLKTILSDKKALAIILVMPIILMSILSFALKGVFVDDWEMNKVNIAVVKQYETERDNKSFAEALQNGILSQGMGSEGIGSEGMEDIPLTDDKTNPESIFFDDFLESEEVSDIVSYRIETEERARALLREEKISAIVFLPEKYIYNMKINLLTPFRNEVEIDVLTNPDNRISGEIVRSIMKAYSNTMSSMIIGKNVLIEATMANDLGDNGIDGIETVMSQLSDELKAIRIEVDDVTLEGKDPITSADYYAAAMLTMFILFAAGHGGRMLLEEKENTTYQRLMAAGTSKLAILTGKFITIFLIALFQIIVMIVFSHFALKVVWGDLTSVLLIGIAAAFAVAGVGLTVAAATYQAGNYKMASIFETLIIQTMALLGGSFLPVDSLPAVIQKLSFLSLNGIALKAYLKTMMGYHLEAVIGYITALAVIGAVFALLAVAILREKGGQIDAKYYQAKTAKA